MRSVSAREWAHIAPRAAHRPCRRGSWGQPASPDERSGWRDIPGPRRTAAQRSMLTRLLPPRPPLRGATIGLFGSFLVFFLVAVPLIFLGEFGTRHHGDVLRSKPVRRVARNALHRHLCAGISELGIVLEVAALGGGKRRARRIALAVINDAELVPRKWVLVVPIDRYLQDLLGF